MDHSAETLQWKLEGRRMMAVKSSGFRHRHRDAIDETESRHDLTKPEFRQRLPKHAVGILCQLPMTNQTRDSTERNTFETAFENSRDPGRWVGKTTEA